MKANSASPLETGGILDAPLQMGGSEVAPSLHVDDSGSYGDASADQDHIPQWLAHDEAVDLPSPTNWSAIAAWIIAATWIAGFSWIETRGFSALPVIERVPQLVAIAAGPIVVLLLAVMLVERGSERSIRRHVSLLDALRSEQNQLVERLSVIDRHWAQSQERLTDRANHFAAASLEAGQRIETISASINTRMRDVAVQAAAVAEQGDSARRHMDGLLLALPKIEVVARRAADNMRLSGQSAYQYGGQLEAQIAAIRSEATEAELRLQSAENGLSDRLAELIAANTSAHQGTTALSDQFATMLNDQREAALAMLADLAVTMDINTTSVENRLQSARDMLTAATDAQLAALHHGVEQTDHRVLTLANSIANAAHTVEQLDTGLDATIHAAITRVGAMEQATQSSIDAVAGSLGTLTSVSDAVAFKAQRNLDTATAMNDEAGRLAITLASAAQTLESTLPRAVANLHSDVTESHTLLETLAPMVATHSSGTEASLQKLRMAEEMMGQQMQTLVAIDRTAAASIGAQSGAFADLRNAIESLAARMQAIGDDDAPAMLSHLTKAEAAAAHAADRARAAIDTVVDASALRLRTAFDTALDQAAGQTAAARVDAIAQSAERAVSAASVATDRLMRQLITIADSSAALEARMNEVASIIDHGARESMARQVTAIAESLNSTAVDMTRILSVDIADQAWESYLKGDRGIFSRRAVRLLTNSEARDILQRYQNDDDFRLLVNRYIHDFEGMLRGLLETRDGSAVSVILLSSDLGKTYVALAQAIERLRG